MQAGLDDMEENVVGISDAATYKETLDAYLRNGTIDQAEYDKRIAANSAKIMESVNKGLEDLEETDYQALGYSKSEWDAMEDDEKKLAIFDSVGQMVKDGIVTGDEYEDMLVADIKEEFATTGFKNSKNKPREASKTAVIITDLYDNGYLRQDQYTDIMYNLIVPQVSFFDDIVKVATENLENDGLNLKYNPANKFRTEPKEWQEMTDEQKTVLYQFAIFIAKRQKKTEGTSQTTPGSYQPGASSEVSNGSWGDPQASWGDPQASWGNPQGSSGAQQIGAPRDPMEPTYFS